MKPPPSGCWPDGERFWHRRWRAVTVSGGSSRRTESLILVPVIGGYRRQCHVVAVGHLQLTNEVGCGPRALSGLFAQGGPRSLDPDSRFTPGTAQWGLQGIIRLPDRPSDFVFFVSFGRSMGQHSFDEGITPGGVLSWQSQPRQGFKARTIKELITHDELIGNIYLFLRTSMSGPYTYLGKLRYLGHDATREQPVYFHWQILDWNPPEAMLERIGLVLDQPTEVSRGRSASDAVAATIVDPPPVSTRHQGRGSDTNTFRTRRVANRPELDASNRRLGLAGEQFVIELERRNLVAAGRADLASRIRHIAVELGDGAGYDVLSFEDDGAAKHIEVKTTRGPAETDFFISENERAYSEQNGNQFYLYRVHNFDESTRTGDAYILRGPVDDSFTLRPTQYRARR